MRTPGRPLRAPGGRRRRRALLLALLAALAVATCAGQAAGAATLASTWGTLGNGPGQLSTVNDVDVAADGLVYVADSHGEIDVFTPEGVYQRSIGSPGTGAGQFAVGPYSVSIGRNGDVYATGRPGDTPSGTLKVLRFAQDGTFLGSFGAFPTTSFAYVAASPTGPVYVSWNAPGGGGFGDYRHVRFDADGGNETPFGPTDLQWGRDIAVTDDGQTVVLMGFDARPLVSLNADGSVRARFGAWVLGGAPGTFVVPNALAVVGQTVLVTDSTGQNPTVIPTRVHRFTLDGTFEGFTAEVPEAQRLSWGAVAGDCAGNLYLGFYGPAVDRYTGAAPTCAAARSVTGTVVEQRCSATSCTRTGLAGVTVAATGGPEGPVSAVTGKDGTYALQLKEGSWTLTPSLDDRTFDPASRPLDVRGDVTGVDFKTCAGAKAATNGRRLQATEPCPIDLVVEGIELTNGIQEEKLLDLSDGQGGAGRPPVPTGNIPLVAGRTLAVRVYVSTQALRESLQDEKAAAAQGATRVPVLIEVRQGSRVLRRVTETIPTVAPWPVLPAARTNLLGSVATVVVPAAEVGPGRVVVSVKLNQGANAVDECKTAVCTANDDVEVQTEAIRTTPPSVFLIPLKTATEGSISSSWGITDIEVERIWPVARGSFAPATIRGSSLDITRAIVRSGEPSGKYRLCAAEPACSSALEADLNAKLKTWWIAAGRPAGNYIALVPDTLGGYLGTTSGQFPTTWAQPRVLTPLHELMHQLGFGHSDSECGGGANGESQDPAWPAGRGVIRGYAIDFNRSETIGRRFGTFGPPGPWYDVMSYCRDRDLRGRAPDTWASTINWGRMLALLSGRPSLSRAPAAAASSLLVDATVQADGTVAILGLTPTDLRPDAPAGAPTHTVSVRNAAGDVVASLPVTAVPGREGQSATIEAVVPAAGAARIEIASPAGDVLASRAGSTTPLAVTIAAPARGARVGAGTPLAVRWTATASEGVELQAAVDLSLDGGRTWRTLAAAIEETTATIPAAALSRSTGAQLRVRVTDGIVERAAVVTGLRLAGAPPRVRISTPLPAKGATIPAGSAAALTAVALDDADRPITGKRLRWLDGTKPVGSGGTLRLAKLTPGTHRIVLVATDRFGRSGRASLTVKVAKR